LFQSFFLHKKKNLGVEEKIGKRIVC